MFPDFQNPDKSLTGTIFGSQPTKMLLIHDFAREELEGNEIAISPCPAVKEDSKFLFLQRDETKKEIFSHCQKTILHFSESEEHLKMGVM